MSDGSVVMSGNGSTSMTQVYCGATTEQLNFTISNSKGVGLCCDSSEQCGYYAYVTVVCEGQWGPIAGYCAWTYLPRLPRLPRCFTLHCPAMP